METKVCTKCSKRKPLDEFARKAKRSSERMSQCKDCRVIATRRWRHSLPRKERSKVYRKYSEKYRERIGEEAYRAKLKNGLKKRTSKNDDSRKIAVRNNKRWTPQEDEVLRKHPDKTYEELALILNRTIKSVDYRIGVLKLRSYTRLSKEDLS